MRTIATLLATAGLLAGITVSSAQTPAPAYDPQGRPGGVGSNPSSNPTGAPGGMSGTTGAGPSGSSSTPNTQAPPSPSGQPQSGQGNPDDTSRFNPPVRR